jgi:hypothetical protein
MEKRCQPYAIIGFTKNAQLSGPKTNSNLAGGLYWTRSCRVGVIWWGDRRRLKFWLEICLNGGAWRVRDVLGVGRFGRKFVFIYQLGKRVMWKEDLRKVTNLFGQRPFYTKNGDFRRVRISITADRQRINTAPRIERLYSHLPEFKSVFR